MTKFTRNLENVVGEFSRADLARTCTMAERDFADFYDMSTTQLPIGPQVRPGEDFFHFRDNGSKVLAVAHLDTVSPSDEREAHFVRTAAGEVVYSRALDDRLGAYIILELLPRLGINYDVLLTVGEESGNSTAEYFDAPKRYDWLIEFDRGGTDVVMYQYDDTDTRAAVRATGAHVGDGIFSDISYMEHLGVKGFNWGVGYRDYHGPRAHAYLDDTLEMVARYLKFHQQNEGTYMPHFESYSERSNYDWDDAIETFDRDGIYQPTEYFDREYVTDPTIEEIQAHMEAMDEEYQRHMEDRAS